MSQERYEGWANYETWACMLWIDNDQGEQEHFHALARETKPIDHDYMEPDRRRVHGVAGAVEAAFEERAEEWMSDQASFCADLLNHALARVDWVEIAEHLIEAVDEAAEPRP